jgi:hypothetical protein
MVNGVTASWAGEPNAISCNGMSILGFFYISGDIGGDGTITFSGRATSVILINFYASDATGGPVKMNKILLNGLEGLEHNIIYINLMQVNDGRTFTVETVRGTNNAIFGVQVDSSFSDIDNSPGLDIVNNGSLTLDDYEMVNPAIIADPYGHTNGLKKINIRGSGLLTINDDSLGAVGIIDNNRKGELNIDSDVIINIKNNHTASKLFNVDAIRLGGGISVAKNNAPLISPTALDSYNIADSESEAVFRFTKQTSDESVIVPGVPDTGARFSIGGGSPSGIKVARKML